MSDLSLAFNTGDKVVVTTKNGEDLTGDSSPLALNGQKGEVLKTKPGERHCYLVRYGTDPNEVDWFRADEVYAPSQQQS